MTQALEEQKRRVRDDFDRKAERWRAMYEAPRDFRSYNLFTRRRTILEMFPETSGFVVDVGCGTGDFILHALERAPRVVGIEVSAEMARNCLDKFRSLAAERRALFCRGDVEAIPLPDASAGAVLCVAVIEYLLDADRALAEIARVLAPGGFAIITVPNRASPFILLDNASKAARRVGSRAYRLLTGRPRDDGSYMHGYYTPWGLDWRIRRAGLVVEERGYSTFGSYMYGNVLPFSVALSESLGFLRHRPLGVLGSNYIVRASRPRPGAGAGDRRGRS